MTLDHVALGDITHVETHNEDRDKLNELDTRVQTLEDAPAPTVPVTSVNSETGDVVLDAAGVGAHPDTWKPEWSTDILDKPATFPPSAHDHAQSEITGLVEDLSSLDTRVTTLEDAPSGGGGTGGAVDSVNGHTGTVVLNAGDVGAVAAGDPHIGIAPLTTTQRDALSGLNLWSGRIIFNTDSNRLEQYSSGAWHQIYISGGSIYDSIDGSLLEGSVHLDEVYSGYGEITHLYVQDLATTAGGQVLDTAMKGAAGGVATLDSNAKLPASQLSSLIPDVSNLTDMNLRRYRAALANAVAGNGLCRIAWIGDSITSGVGAGSFAAAWPNVTGRMMSSVGIAHGFGASPPQNGFNTLADSRYAFTSAQAGAGGTVFWSSIPQGQSVTFTSTEPGTVIEYLWNNGGGFSTSKINVQIDGGSITTVSGNNSGNATVTRLTGLANTTHTIKLTALAGAMTFGYIAVLPASGVVMDNWGYGGSESADWVQQTGYDLRSFPVWEVVPNLAIVALGTNDVAQSVSASTYQSNITTIVQGFQAINVDVLLVSNIPINPTNIGSYPSDWTAYRTALRSVSSTLGVPLLDLGARWNYDGAAAQALGLISSGDGIHPTSAGAADMASAVLPVLAVAGGDFNKAAIGLANVDNTSDMNKPLSNPQLLALGNAQNAMISEIALGNLSGAINLSTYTAQLQSVSMTAIGNLTFNASTGGPTITAGTAPRLTMRITQDGTGGRTLTTTNVTWPGGTQPALSTTPGAVDVLEFRWISGVCYGMIWKVPTTSTAVSAAPLTRTSYTPGSTATTITPASATATNDADATNLAVSFTVPASGKVRVILEGTVNMTQASGYIYWSLRNGTTDVVGSERHAGALGIASARMRNHLAISISGLTPGASITYKWAVRGTGASLQIGGGTEFATAASTNYGPAIMTVFAE